MAYNAAVAYLRYSVTLHYLSLPKPTEKKAVSEEVYRFVADILATIYCNTLHGQRKNSLY